MCGLFGAVLPTLYPSAEVSVSWCLRFLGVRGQDAAGIAVCRADTGWTVAKTLGPFRALYGNRRSRERLLLGQPVSALGHTRWATQGGRPIAQASPLTAGPLLCTHNGDLDATAIPWTASGVNDESGTDSHRFVSGYRRVSHTRSWSHRSPGEDPVRCPWPGSSGLDRHQPGRPPRLAGPRGPVPARSRRRPARWPVVGVQSGMGCARWASTRGCRSRSVFSARRDAVGSRAVPAARQMNPDR